MNKRPLIGITAFETTHRQPPHTPLYALGQRYAHAVETGGGAGIILAPGLSDESLREIFARLDGLLLSGGGDIDPARYGESPHPALGTISPARDHAEVLLAQWAVQADKPLLCICRGIQVLNVALGGSLIQDIPGQVAGALQHNFDSVRVPHEQIAHPVEIEPGSRLADALGTLTAQVNSWHHQALARVASPLHVVARAPDGIIEAVEIPHQRFIVGVQWHPEWLYDTQPEMLRLFQTFVRAASANL